jgi:CheY-like chemotaxis protein
VEEELGAPAANSEVAPQGSETVFVIDDNPAVRSSVCKVLQERGYLVLEAVNGPEALRVSQNFAGKIDLLLTDVTLPGMSGKDVAQHLLALRPDLKLLYMTGYTHTQAADAVPLPVPVFRKPFTGAALARKVRAVLDGSEENSHTEVEDKKKRG